MWAMNCERYDVSLLRFRDDKTFKQTAGYCTLDGMNVMLGDLVRQNAQGENIIIRPELSLDRALVLVDDVEEMDIEKLRDNGLEPCCVVETSPKNYQAWIDFGPEPMPLADRKILARWIAGFVDADPASADAVHYGRLAGFTNQKPSHFGDGRHEWQYPYVLCRYAERLICSKADGARQWARERAQDAARAMETKNAAFHTSKSISGLKSAFERYCVYWEENPSHARRKDGTDDLSKRDYAVVGRLLREGHDAEQIIPLLAESAGRKNNAMDYARRTVEAAVQRTASK